MDNCCPGDTPLGDDAAQRVRSGGHSGKAKLATGGNQSALLARLLGLTITDTAGEARTGTRGNRFPIQTPTDGYFRPGRDD